MDQLRALREAKADRLEGRVTKTPVTVVTKVAAAKRTGRPRAHETNAERQRAYRERRKAVS